MPLTIWNLNLQTVRNECPQGSDYNDWAKAKLDRIADYLNAQEKSASIGQWDLLGVNELPSYRDGGIIRQFNLRGPFGHIIGGLLYLTASQHGWSIEQALADEARGSKSHQHGEVGVAHRSQRLTRLSVFEAGDLGYDLNGWFGTTERQVAGARYLLTEGDGDGFVLPFFSTHLSTAETKPLNRTKMVGDLIRRVHEWHRPGDLTPVVVGDFNFDRTSKLWDRMAVHFQEISLAPSEMGIDHVWVGRRQSFPGAIGAVSWNSRKRQQGFKSPSLSDHPAVYVEVQPPAERLIAIHRDDLHVEPHGQEHVLMSAGRRLFAFGELPDAIRTARVIQSYGADRLGIVGEGAATYLLTAQGAPTGGMEGEACKRFDTAKLAVVQTGSQQFALVADTLLLNFDTEGEALRTLSLVGRYGFNTLCFVGEPRPSFHYWRQ